MKFLISATSIYSDQTHRLLENYPFLRDYNFEIKELKRPKIRWIRDEKGKLIKQFEEGKFDTYCRAYINVDDLQSLLELLKKAGDLVLTESTKDDADFEIEIYDDYRE